MGTPNNDSILYRNIGDLDVSPEFKAMMVRNGFGCLDELLGVGMNNVVNLPMSGYRILRELVGLLEENGLGELVE